MNTTTKDLTRLQLLLDQLVTPAAAAALVDAARAKVAHYSNPDARPTALEIAWYKSVAAGRPDFSIYEIDEYVAEAFACWRVYSRGYVRALGQYVHAERPAKPETVKPRSFVDLGCGLGFTTAALSVIFTNARALATNVPDGLQGRIAALAAPGALIVEAVDHIHDTVDLVFASEYFEHFEAPLDHLLKIVERLSPEWIVCANAFGARSVGHFPHYLVDGAAVPNDKIGRLFAAQLRALGYSARETGFWNNRPQIWHR